MRCDHQGRPPKSRSGVNSARWLVDQRLAKRYTPLIQRALGMLLPWEAIAHDTTKAAAIPEPDTTELRDVLRRLYTDSWEAGAGLAGGVERDVNWSRWQPGNSATARLIESDGLKQLLDAQGVHSKGQGVLASIADTSLSDLADKIAEAVDQGWNAATLSDAIRPLLDVDRASMIASTEVNRGMNTAAMDWMKAAGTEMVLFLTADDADVDEECAAAQDAGPTPIDDVDMPPLHPNCRCTITAADSAAGTEMTGDDSGE